MTEDSSLWTTGGAGDGAATITRADWSNILTVMGGVLDDEGVAPAYLNALVGTVPGANTARIGTGGGVVDGKPYWNTAAVDVTIPSASGGGNTRIDRVVLRADWTLQTVRITRIAGTDAASPTAPVITQTTGVTYDIKLYQALVDTGGTVTLTDERVFARPGANSVTRAALAQGAAVSLIGRATGTIGDVDDIAAGADGDVMRRSGTTIAFGTLTADSVDDTMVGNRVPAFTRRQGGSATDWSIDGTTTYTPTAVRMQAGKIEFTSVGTNVGLGGTVTFPVAFSYPPLVLVSLPLSSSTGARLVGGYGSVTAADVNITAYQRDGASFVNGETVEAAWLAFGTE